MLLLGLLLVLVILGVLATTYVFWTRRITRLALLPPSAEPAPVDCSRPLGRLPLAADADVVIAATTTRLDIRGNNVELPPGVTLWALSDFTLVAFGDLTIHGSLKTVTGGDVNITLVSVNGSVRIGSLAVIGPPPGTVIPGATGATGVYARALGVPGTSGGSVKIKGRTVIIEGTVVAESGGRGGGAFARGAGISAFGGLAVAGGGMGGFGGKVLICAEEAIDLVGFAEVSAGHGGDSGKALAVADHADEAIAFCGPGNRGGDVEFVGTGAGACPVTFRQVGRFAPDGDRWHRRRRRTGDRARGRGPVALRPLRFRLGNGELGAAVGGEGGKGGTVVFSNCVVSTPAVVTAGSGGRGGNATAVGGTGVAAELLSGYRGGRGDARGGDGGLRGDLLTFPLIGGGNGTVLAPAVIGGTGGTATASGGSGGRGGTVPYFGSGGPSGRANALGGSNPNGGTATLAPAPPTAGGVAPRGAGGIGPQVTSTGAP